MRQILFIYAVTSKVADMLVVVKESGAVYPAMECQSSKNLKAPLGLAGTDYRELLAIFPRLLQTGGKNFCY
jgi:hypothetical protein